MDEVRVRGPHDPVTAFGKPEAEVDVIEGHAEIYFIKSAHLREDCLADREAGAGHRGTILLEPCAIEISGMSPWNMRKGVPGHAPETEDNAAMLEGAVGKPEPR